MSSKLFNKSILFSLLIVGIVFSCKKSNQSILLLQEAQYIMESNPAQALMLIDSIQSPEAMPESEYMEYIVTRVQAKFKNQQDISNDTLIINASDYFVQKGDDYNAAFAYLYTALLFSEKGMQDKALEKFLLAETFSKKATNNLLIARSQHNIGNIYFNQDLMNNAIINYQSALHYYNNIEGMDIPKLQLLNLIGRSLELVNKSDSAYFYYKAGLDMSKEQNNLNFQSKFNHNLGILSREKKDYNRASDYFFTALKQTSNSADSLRVYLNLIRLYNSTHELDSAAYYSELMTERLSEIEDNYVLLSMYKSLSDYHQLKGDLEQALYYRNLQQQVNEKIVEVNNSEKLLSAENKYRLSVQERAAERKLLLCIEIGLILLVILIAYLIDLKRKHKHQKNAIENKRLKIENQLLRQEYDNYLYLESIYKEFIIKWSELENSLNKESTEGSQHFDSHPYSEIKPMVDGLKSKANDQLLKLAIKYLHSNSDVGDKAARFLTEQELILMMLCYFEYSETAIAAILDIKLEKLDLEERKLRIATRLKKAGMAEYDINLILYSEKM